MGITDELREYSSTFMTDAKLLEIADRIDIAHKHAIGYVDDRDPETMAENGWVKLPVDVNDVPIRIGDALVLQHEVKEKPYVVQGLTWDGEDWYFTCEEGFFNVCGWEHYKKPTVEGMLWELLGKIRPDMEDEEAVPIVKAYAEKLRLADVEGEQGNGKN